MSKEWYLRKKAEDPNYFKQQRERFYTKHPDYYVKQAKKHYQKNPQVVILGGKRWRQANLEKSNAGFAARRSKVPLKDYCEKCHVRPLCGKNRTHKKGRYRCTLWIEKDAGGSKA